MARDELARGRKLTAAARAFLEKSPGLTTPGAQRRRAEYFESEMEKEHRMPPKGARAMGEDRELVSIRLPRSTVAKIDARVERLQRENPDLPINRTHAVNNLIRIADAAIAAAVTDTVTDTTVTDTVTDTPDVPVVTESKTARPKTTAKRKAKTTRTTKAKGR